MLTVDELKESLASASENGQVFVEHPRYKGYEIHEIEVTPIGDVIVRFYD